MTETTDILQQLKQPLEPRRVKRRQAPGEGSVPYLEGFAVIQTANQIFDYRWSFDLLSEPRVMIWEQSLTAYDRQRRERVPVLDPESGQPKTQRAGMVYLTGKVTVELDGKAYTHADVGRLSFTGDSPEALDTALSGAATDCLKRCSRQLGDQIGLSLYDKGHSQKNGKPVTDKVNSARSNGKHAQAADESPSQNGSKDELSLDEARSVPCPVGSVKNPHWSGLPLGQVLDQPDGRRMLEYLAGEQFQDHGDPQRVQARLAARLLLGEIQPQGA